MAREIDINTLDNAGPIGCMKDPEIQDLLGSFERESDENSFLRKLRGEEDFSSSLSTSLGSEVTISRESSIFRDDLLFSRNETPGGGDRGEIVTEDSTHILEGSECERINLLVEKCNKSDVERYTLSFQEDSQASFKLTNITPANTTIDHEHNYKNGNINDDYQDLPVNLRRSTVNRCMNEQVLRDEIASPFQRFNPNYRMLPDEDRKEELFKLFTTNQDSSPSSSGKGYSSMSVTSQESSPGYSDVGTRTQKGAQAGTNYRKTFEELERQRREIAQALPIPGVDESTGHKAKPQEPFDVYLSESALAEFKSSPHDWLRRTSLMSTPKGFEKIEAMKTVTDHHKSFSADGYSRVERPTSFSKKSRNSASSSETIYVCYPNYSLPDMTFVQKIIGQSSPGLVLSPTKPKIRAQKETKGKTRPKSFGGYEKLSRENFSHIKDWDSLNVLLPDDLRKMLDESSQTYAPPQPPPFQGGVLRRNKTRNSRNHRFSLQEPLIATIGEEEDEETKSYLFRSESNSSCQRPRQVRPPCSAVGWQGNNHCCHRPVLPSPCTPQMSHCHASHCCPSLKESQMESLSKEKLNKLLSMSDALEEITSLLGMVTSMKNAAVANPNPANGAKAKEMADMRRDIVKKPRPVSMTSCNFKSQIPVIKSPAMRPTSAVTAPKVTLRNKARKPASARVSK